MLYCCFCLFLYLASDKETEYVPYYGQRGEAVLQITTTPDVRENGTFYGCKLLSFDGKETELSGRIRLFVKEDMGTFVYGDVLQSHITITEPDVARNPGNFDYKQYLLTLNIGATATVSSVGEMTWLQNTPENVVVALSLQCRAAMLKALQTCMPNGSSYLTQAIFLGDKDYLDDGITDVFSVAGISHFMAVSGAHAAFFLMPFSFLLKKVGMKKQRRYFTEILLLLCYVAIAGFGIPIVRAGIMMSLKRLAFLLKRDYDPLIALLLALSVLMVYNPYVIYSISMQLSFGAVLSMLWIQPVFKKWLTSFRVAAYISDKILNSVCLCLSVQLGTLPVLINQFQMPSVVTVLTNLFCAPLIELIMIGGIAITILGLVQVSAVGKLLGYGVYFLGEIVRIVAEYFANLGRLQTWRIVSFDAWQVLLYYVLLAGVIRIAHKGWKRCMAGILCAFLLLCSIQWPTGQLQLTCIDVGQGECIYLRTPSGHHYLIDCGSSSVGQVAEYRILPYLKTEKVTQLTGIFLSHYDADHISGLQAILEAYGVTYLFLPDVSATTTDAEIVLNLAASYGTEVRYWKKGDVMTDGAVSMQCLHPVTDANTEDSNALSMVLKVEYGEFDALLTGDLPMEAENDILNVVGNCDVLKVGHHGSSTSTGEPLLEIVQPQIALISCGENNRYGHPAQEVLDRLEKAGSQVYITAEGGALTVTTNGENIVVTNFL